MHTKVRMGAALGGGVGRTRDGEGCEGGLSQFYNDLLVLKRSEAKDRI